MKKAEVELGGRYKVRVSGTITTVRITNPSIYKGWDGVNEMTGRSVRIKTAARLRRPAGGVWVITSSGRYLTDEPSWVADRSKGKRFTTVDDGRAYFKSLSGTDLAVTCAKLEELAK